MTPFPPARRMLSLLCAAELLMAALPCTGLEYRPVKVGGGGYVAGIVATPRSAVGTPYTFFRTDVGGCYRLLNTSGRSCEDGCSESIEWKPLSQRFTHLELVRWRRARRIPSEHLSRLDGGGRLL